MFTHYRGAVIAASGGSPPPYNPLDDSPELWLDSSDGSTMYDAATGGSVVSSGGYVGRILDKSGKRRNFVQATSAYRPQFLTGDGLQFDGTSQFLSQDPNPAFSSATTLPNGGSGSTTGKGWTNTGLFWDSTDSCFWVGNDGRTDSGDTTYDPSIIKLSEDLTTIIAQIDVKALWADNSTVQGVCVDTSDNSLWFAALQENKIRNLTKAGASIGEISFTSPNGLAYDAANDRLIVLDSSGTVSIVNPSTGSTVSNYSTGLISTQGVDQLFFDAAKRHLYVSYENNGIAGKIRVFDHDTGINIGELGPFSEALSIEGITIHNGFLWICNDGYFHDTGTKLNEILKYNLNGGVPIAGRSSQVTVALVGRAKTAASPTRGWFTSGRAITAASGTYGLYPLSGDTTIRSFINAELDDVSVSGGAGTTADAIVMMTINGATNQGAITINGGTPSTFSITTTGNKITTLLPQMLLGCGENSTLTTLTPDRYSQGRTKEMLVFAGLPDRQRIEGYLAHKWSLTSLLPSGHPYKSSAP